MANARTLATAATLHERAGNTARTVALLEKLVADYPTPVAERIENRQTLAELAKRAGNADRERYWLREIVKAEGAAGAARTDRTRTLAARASLALAQPARDSFRAIRLAAPLNRTLTAKRKALESALAGYRQAGEYGVAEVTTAASFETAELYRTLARDLLDSERPARLSADAREQYDLLLEEQAFPFEEQSIKLHEANAALVRDGIYDDGVRGSFASLAQLSPARYGKTEDAPPAPTDTAQLESREALLREQVERERENATAWNDLGLTLRARGRFADARTAYDRAIEIAPQVAAPYRNRAVLEDLYLDDPASALRDFERYRELGGDDRALAGWIAELRQRTGVKAPAAPAAEAEDAASEPAATTGEAQ